MKASRNFPLTKDGAILTLRLGVPFTTTEMACEVVAICSEVNSDPEIRVVILALAGSSSVEVPGSDPQAAVTIIDSVARIAKPVICIMDGDAVGVGLELALACDFRIACETSVFAMPQVRTGGIPYAGGTQRLPRLIGRAKALEMLLTGTAIEAEEACRIGLVHQIVADADLATAAGDLAKDMAAAAPLSMRLAKEAIHAGMDMTLEQGLRLELDLYLLLFSTHDRREGIMAFREKRNPSFTGS